jgi:hypothetical protein
MPQSLQQRMSVGCCLSQVMELKAALVKRHPNSVNALLAAAQPAAADQAAAAAAAEQLHTLTAQIEEERRQHETSLRDLQQQYQALKLHMEQQQVC